MLVGIAALGSEPEGKEGDAFHPSREGIDTQNLRADAVFRRGQWVDELQRLFDAQGPRNDAIDSDVDAEHTTDHVGLEAEQRLDLLLRQFWIEMQHICLPG